MPKNDENQRAARLLKKITHVFPGVSWKSYVYIDEGWDHEVVILDDALVFRFPTDDEYREKLQTEIEILEYLKKRVPITIPEYTYMSPSKDFAGYSKIPGLQLSKERFDALSETKQKNIARQLASFLSVIHAEDITQPVFKKASASYLEADQKEVKAQIDRNLKSHLGDQDLNIVARIVREVDGLIGKGLPRVFIHNDVYSRHLLWDEEERRLGLIDFSDMSIDDPAIDFAELYEYGFDFVRQVYDFYTGPKDQDFLERAWTYQKWIAVYMMTDYFENHKTSFEEARETFDRVKRQLLALHI